MNRGPCVLDTSPVFRLADFGLLNLVCDLFSPVYVPTAVLNEVLTPPEIRKELVRLIASGAMVEVNPNGLQGVQRALYDVTMASLRPYMTDDSRSPNANAGEMNAVSIGKALDVPVIVMDDGDAEDVLRYQLGWDEDTLLIFHGAELIIAGKTFGLIDSKTARACIKRFTGEGLNEQTAETKRLAEVLINSMSA